MSRIDAMLNSKPAMPVAGLLGIVGVGAVALGVMALVGRFDFANKMGHFLGKAGKIGLTAGGAAAVALAIAAIVRRLVIGNQGKQEGSNVAGTIDLDQVCETRWFLMDEV